MYLLLKLHDLLKKSEWKMRLNEREWEEEYLISLWETNAYKKVVQILMDDQILWMPF